MFSREKIAAVVAEFLGTATLATVIFAMIGRTTFPFFADVVAGLAVGSLMLVTGAVGSVHLNPVVTLGMWTLRKINTVQALLYITAQMLGGLGAWALLTYLLNKPLTSLAAKSFDWRVLTAEALGAFIFAFGVAAASYEGFKGLKLAYAVGASLMLGMMVASVASNGLVNPAVAVGVQSWDRSYVIGPIVGSVVGMNLYTLLFASPGGLRLSLGRVTSTVKKPAARRKTTRRRR